MVDEWWFETFFTFLINQVEEVVNKNIKKIKVDQLLYYISNNNRKSET